MTSTNEIAIQNGLYPYYPEQPGYSKNCNINQIYQSIPPSSPNEPTFWETTAVGPTSVKHIYTGVPNYYPYQKITRPTNTLYGHDYSQFHESGVGKGKRISYHYKPYPLTDRNVRETREYSDYMLPYMDTRSWIKYPVIETTSVNNPTFREPNARVVNNR